MVILIISLLAAAAVPALAHLKRKARTTAVVNDFRVFATAFETYAHETGGWPAESAVGVVPPVMAGRLNTAAWTRPTVLGGKYNWERNRLHNGTRYVAAISISAATGAPLPLDVAQLLDIDRTIDDGDLGTGNFLAGASNVPLYVIQK